MKRHIVFLLLACLVAGNNHAQTPGRDIRWQQFMDRQALIWDSISPDYYTGILLGNGLMGANIYQENDHAIRFDIGRSDVIDQRPHIDSVFTESLLTHARLPIGRMTLQTNGKITGAHMRLDIYNAEASGTISTTAGYIIFKSFAPANDHVIYIEAIGSGGEKDLSWKWIGEQSVSPRVANSRQKFPIEYLPNPPFQIKDSAGYGMCYQPLYYQGEYATVWKKKSAGAGQTMVIATGYSPDKKGVATAAAISAINNFCKKGLLESTREHSGWWHHFYQQSFVSLPDGRMESFYWIQLYKLASATRPDKPMADLMGPWFTTHTPWPGVWWNLNTQLIYSPIFTSNHLELGRSLYQAFINHLPNLIKNVPAAWQYDAAAIGRISSYDLVSPLVTGDLRDGRFEPGDLTWALFYYYQYYAYSLDSMELRTKVFPLLRRSVNYIIHLLQKDGQGIYHLPVSFSPEYKEAPDANYTLSSLYWGLQTLLHADSICNLHSPEKDKWKWVLQNLAPFPADSTGFTIGKDVDLTESHRHYSHLLMIYPYHLINWAQPDNHQLIEASVRHWLSLKSALAGFSYSGAASLYAAMGKGDTAYAYLNDLLTKYVKPNTLYREAGPVMETPLSAAASLLEMLLQSWGGKICVFPALPVQWKDASFDRLRAEGAFLVSAQRKDGITESVVIKSIKGGKCVVQTSMTDIHIRSDRRREIPHSIHPGQENGWSDVQFNCVPGETIVLYRKGASDKIGPVKQTIFPDWRWGLNKSP